MASALTREEVEKFLQYDAETGALIWKAREVFTYADKAFNKRFAGRIAGTARNNGYIQICVRHKLYLAHRLAWLMTYGDWPKPEVDHINGNKSDNRITNLRSASQSENQQNRNAQKNNTSGFMGVTAYGNGRWRSSICKNKKKTHIGVFDTPEEAYSEYLKHKVRIHTFNPKPRMENAQ